MSILKKLSLTLLLAACNPVLYPEPECSKTNLQADVATSKVTIPKGTPVAACKCKVLEMVTLWADESKTSAVVVSICDGKPLPHVTAAGKVTK